MNISVIGTGYVGLVTGVCFAEMGNQVTCIDIDADKVTRMKRGECPIYEPGLEELMESCKENETIEYTTQFDSVKDSEVIFLAVGTPSGSDGSADLSFLFTALDNIAPHLKESALVVLKSTVPIGTNIKVKKHLSQKTETKFHLVNNPEFLKEGSAVEDFMRPERVIIGCESDEAFDKMERLYRPFMRQMKRTIRMSNLSAEMTKYAANCFLATKISFINEIAKLCDLTGADVSEVRAGISTDSRIGSQFLYPGPGYGGSCFPKDVKALIHTAQINGLDLKIVKATEEVNALQKLYMFEKAKEHFKDLKGKTIAIWGVAFKANTDDIRETPAIYITQALNEAGAQVKFYDPVAAENFDKFVKENSLLASMSEDKYSCLEDADALMVLTEWKEFRVPNLKIIAEKLRQRVIFDGRNLYDKDLVTEAGFQYFAVGKQV